MQDDLFCSEKFHFRIPCIHKSVFRRNGTETKVQIVSYYSTIITLVKNSNETFYHVFYGPYVVSCIQGLYTFSNFFA